MFFYENKAAIRYVIIVVYLMDYQFLQVTYIGIYVSISDDISPMCSNEL
jgi:hypothetical protein